MTDIASMVVPTPIGLAAGFDKYTRIVRQTLKSGFGFTTVGTITLEPHSGNPKPNFIKLEAQGALVNSMGFPNPGLQYTLGKLNELDRSERKRCLVSLAVTSIEDVVEMYSSIPSDCGGVELNISCPNVREGFIMSSWAALETLLKKLSDIKHIPIFVKLSRDRRSVLSDAEISLSNGADGLIVANTRSVVDSNLSTGSGGLSGSPLLDETIEFVSVMRYEFGWDIPIIATGGIGSFRDISRALSAGATAVQMYTALYYRWFDVLRNINMRLKPIDKLS